MSTVLRENLRWLIYHSNCKYRCPFCIRAVAWIVATELIFLVEKKLIVELKAVDSIRKIHEAQLLTYMKLAQVRVGLLINFNVELLKEGLSRYVL